MAAFENQGSFLMPVSSALRKFATSFSDEPRGPLSAEVQQLGEFLHVPVGETAKFHSSEKPLIVFVASGAVKLTAQVGLDREQIIAFGFRDEMIVLSENSRVPYELQALTACKIVGCPLAELAKTLTKDEYSAERLVAQLLTSLEGSRERLVLLGRMTAQERVASFLLDLTERIAAIRNGVAVLDLPMSRRDIADSLGLTIETVSRQLSLLREHGIVQTNGRSELVILDLDQLRRLSSRNK
ncbi:MAG: helix-turn-helix domain-containing protein [Erythrobacter sp.]|nr:helix-turn-helix domain-containing protein [Erythrobacter sp.]